MKPFKLFFILFLSLSSLNCAKYKELEPIGKIDIPEVLNSTLQKELGGESTVCGAGFIYLKEYTPKYAMEVARMYLNEYRDRVYTIIILFVYDEELSSVDLEKEEVRKRKATEKTIYIYPRKNMIFSGDFNICYNAGIKDKLE